jgi:hypothetical protein
MELLGFDTETHLIDINHVAPPLICTSWCTGDETSKGLVGGTDEGMDDLIDALFDLDSPMIRIAHRASFDLGVLINRRPEIITNVFELLESGRLHCTIIREKLLNLADHGGISSDPLVGAPIKYSLADLVFQYFGQKIGGKEGADAWRMNYDKLETIPSADWPEAAVQYATDDSVWVVRLWQAQEDRKNTFLAATGIDPFKPLTYRCMFDFSLSLVTAWGMATDATEKKKIDEFLAKELSPEKMQILYDAKILSPAIPPRPAARGVKQHREGCKKSWKDPISGKKVNCDCPPKMTKGKKEAKSTNNLKSYVSTLAKDNPDIELDYTAPSDTYPDGQISVSAAWLEKYAHMDPILHALQQREAVQKLVTTELPRMCLKDENKDPILDQDGYGVISPIVRFPYDSLKKTGRSSSKASDSFPSANGQNIDPRVRKCYRARPHRILGSVDLSGMELGTLAQKCLQLFGFSVLADKINAGVDAHAYLGSQIAYHVDDEFRAIADKAQCRDKESIYDLFVQMKDSSLWEQKHHDMFKHYRTMAKPTGLGLPGGLGIATFIQFAAATYHVVLTKELATRLKEIWFETYPEMKLYFKWITDNCVDERNTSTLHLRKHKKGDELYAYTTPFGMYRAGADYCAACNGAGLQAFSAEGALLGNYRVVRACYDPSLKSILYGCDEYGPVARVINFVHDENIAELADDEQASARLREVGEIMTGAMRVVTPDVVSKYEGVLMHNWDKENGKPI